MGIISSHVDLPIHKLYSLASSSFDPALFRVACEAFARFNEANSDSDLWYFDICPDLSLIVSLKVEPTEPARNRPVCVEYAILSFCWWDSFLKSQHRDKEAYAQERQEFDRRYLEALSRTTAVLGAPLLEGADADEHRHRWAIWRALTGLFVLQQSAYDPQFGLDINYWLCPWSGAAPQPSSPLIDWLCQLP
jgi:hypothetical protein